jgi:uncharacterized protein
MNNNPLIINIGFIVHESVGFSHEFKLDIEDVNFLDEFIATDLQGSIRFDRTQKGLILEGNFQFEVINDCVRCLDTFSQNINFSLTELFAFSEKNMTEAELLVPEGGYLDLEPILREYLLLNIPSNSFCKEDCQGLCKICGKNNNKHECTCVEDQIDPRFSKLKDLLDQDD